MEKANTMSDIRLTQLRKLVEKYGSQRELADVLNITPNQISQWVNGNRTIGEKLARRIETRLKLGYGWMDAREAINKPSSVEVINIEILSKHLEEAIEYALNANEKIPAKSLVQAALAAYDHEMNNTDLVSTMLKSLVGSHTTKK